MSQDAFVVRLPRLTLLIDVRDATATIVPRELGGRLVTLTLSAAELEDFLLPLVTPGEGAHGESATSPQNPKESPPF